MMVDSGFENSQKGAHQIEERQRTYVHERNRLKRRTLQRAQIEDITHNSNQAEDYLNETHRSPSQRA